MLNQQIEYKCNFENIHMKDNLPFTLENAYPFLHSQLPSSTENNPLQKANTDSY